MVTPRQDRKAQTKSRVLKVARVHFERDGFDRASIRGIAKESGVASGTVLLHFSDKLGLLHAALHEDLERTLQRCLTVPSRGALLPRLSKIAWTFYNYYAERPVLSKILLRESLFAEPPWRDHFEAQLKRVQARVAALVEESRDTGDIAPTANGALIAVAFSCFYYFALAAWIQGRVKSPLSMFEALMAQHLSGVRSAAGKNSDG